MNANLNPYEPSEIDKDLDAIDPDYTRLRHLIAGLSTMHAGWLAIVVFSIGPRLVERNALMLIWELVAILFGILLAFRLRPNRAWRLALPVWIVAAMVLPVGIVPSFSNGVWQPYMMLAVLVAISTALLPLLERLHWTLSNRRDLSLGDDISQTRSD
ncbi:hypothetical protein LOC71_01775 [Rhodopirellula sp. JC740]|uniref:Uncharacterized protein n=1 Tax=Rhodopirellula halodulae TaxID=2894198 RepID=A0ABS8NBP6_9BACT|nr:hypothetical protein [Rhodopirellula sp. JC740]MCC9640985.1 hypothetical protein [Rhodopirellula sp. JC740]